MLTEINACATQLFVGARLTAGNDHCTCTGCTRILREGERLTVYAARPEGADTWRLTHLYCRDCEPDTITAPRLGVNELLFQSQLARMMDVRTQQGFQTLLTAHTITRSPPTEGSADRTRNGRNDPGTGTETATARETDVRADTHSRE